MGYLRGGKISRTGDARADAFATETRFVSGKGSATVLRERIGVKM